MVYMYSIQVWPTSLRREKKENLAEIDGHRKAMRELLYFRGAGGGDVQRSMIDMQRHTTAGLGSRVERHGPAGVSE